MGGDNAPDAILAGALDAVELIAPSDTLVLVGDRKAIDDALAQRGMAHDSRIEIEPTTEVIAMNDPPVTAVRQKPGSSIVRMTQLASRRAGDRRCDVVVSAGNTGAFVAASTMSVRRLPGVHRPGIAVTLPTFAGPVILCDVGANTEPKPTHLHQYGHMAAVYANRVTGIDNPRVALMSIGAEETKGSQLVRDANRMMRNDKQLDYVGYVEGRELFAGKANVVVCEGFTGNVILKLAEGLSEGLFRTIAREIMDTDPSLAKRFEPIVRAIYAKHDYHEYGGAPLLGANSICIISHGSSEARTITAAVRTALDFARYEVNPGIVEALSNLDPVEEGAA